MTIDPRALPWAGISRPFGADHAISTRQVIGEFIKVTKDLDAATKCGEDLGLTDDEVAFYDALTNNVAWITALGNDYSYDDIIVRQLANYARPGDLLIGISVSGNSPNCVGAFEWSRANGVKTIGLVGAKRGKMAELADQPVVIDDTHYGRVEDAQMTILHLLCYAFMELPELAA